MWVFRRLLCAMLGATVAAAMVGKPLNISAGDFHTCAVMDNGDAVCFGDGFGGKLGTLATTNVGDSPAKNLTKGIVQLPPGRTAESMSTGNGHTCAMMDNDDVLCFGEGSFGRLGTLATTNVGDSPANDLTNGIVQLPAGRTAVSISVGGSHTCVIMDDGDAVCFGDGFAGKLGTLATEHVGDSPANNLTKGIVKLPTGRQAVSISAGGVHTCAVMDNGDAVCFGFGSRGRLGTLATDNVGDSPGNNLTKGIVQLPAGRQAVSISAGGEHTCAVMDDGDAVCFGSGTNGRLGTLATDNVGDSPTNDLTKGIVQLPPGRQAVSISTGSAHTCAVMDNGDAVCFGLGSNGRLGTLATDDVGDSPANDLTKGIVQLPSGRTAVSISVGAHHTCAVMDNGDAVCFGQGSFGRLGTLATDAVGDSPDNDLSKGIVRFRPLPSPSPSPSVSPTATPSPSSSVSPTTTATPSPSPSVSPTTTGTPSPSSSVSPTTTGTPSPSSSVSSTTTLTPSPSSSASPTATGTPSPSSSVFPTTTVTPSPSSPALDGLGSAAQGADTDDSGISAGPIAAVALLAVAVVIAVAVVVRNRRSRTARRTEARTARSVPTSAESV